VQTNTSTSDERNRKLAANVVLGANPSVSAGAETAEKMTRTSNQGQSFSDVLLRTFNVKALIVRLKEVLEGLGIRHLFVLVDDFSELPEDAMQVVVDVLLAPLNNWSDEFIKFKVAGYPGRIYSGQIDKIKVEEIYLDVYKQYGGSDVSRMEENAIEFTRRLTDTRLAYFTGKQAVEFFEGDAEEIWGSFSTPQWRIPALSVGFCHSFMSPTSSTDVALGCAPFKRQPKGTTRRK